MTHHHALPSGFLMSNITIGQLLSISVNTLYLRALESPQPNLERSVKVLLQILDAILKNTAEDLEMLVMCVMTTKCKSNGNKYKITPEFAKIMRGTFQHGNADATHFSPDILALQLYLQIGPSGSGMECGGIELGRHSPTRE